MSYQSASDLLGLLGEEAYLKLCEEFGGTRVYVPKRLPDNNVLVAAIGMDAMRKLMDTYAPAAIRVPLAKAERARWYRAQGLSNARIGRKLGMTESGVEQLFGRMGDLPDRPGEATKTDQLDLFDSTSDA